MLIVPPIWGHIAVQTSKHMKIARAPKFEHNPLQPFPRAESRPQLLFRRSAHVQLKSPVVSNIKLVPRILVCIVVRLLVALSSAP